MLRNALEQFDLGRVAPPPSLDQNAARKSQLQSLHYSGRVLLLRFADEEVNVLRHNHVTDDHESVTPSHLLEDGHEKIAPTRVAQEALASVAATGNEMKVPGAVISLQVCRT